MPLYCLYRKTPAVCCRCTMYIIFFLFWPCCHNPSTVEVEIYGIQHALFSLFIILCLKCSSFSELGYLQEKTSHRTTYSPLQTCCQLGQQGGFRLLTGNQVWLWPQWLAHCVVLCVSLLVVIGKKGQLMQHVVKSSTILLRRL